MPACSGGGNGGGGGGAGGGGGGWGGGGAADSRVGRLLILDLLKQSFTHLYH